MVELFTDGAALGNPGPGGYGLILRSGIHSVTVYSDSQYVVNAVNLEWVFNWERKGFNKKKNPDLWIRFLKIYRKHKVRLVWIKGHAGHPENERCDHLSVIAAQNGPFKIDQYYEIESEKNPTLFE